jgi:hypothetical protein
MKIENQPGLPRCQIHVVLETAPKIWRKKELLGWNYFRYSFNEIVATSNVDHGPNEMIISRGGCNSGVDTIVFKKADWGGNITHGMYSLDPSQMWPYLGGKKVTFNWVEDDFGSGRWGEATTIPSGYRDGNLLTAFGRPILVLYGRAGFPMDPATRQRLGLDPPFEVPSSFLDRIRSLPNDYTLLREETRTPIYVIFGGAKFQIPDLQTFPRIGLNAANLRIIPNGTLQENGIGDMPQDGTVLREETDPRVFLMRNAQKCHISSPTRLEELCLSWNDVRFVPNGALSHIPTGPTI